MGRLEQYLRGRSIAIMALLVAILFAGQNATAPAAYAQATASPTAGTEATGTTIHAESRLVLVDVIVTDKKGAYIEDLTEKDFKVWEDDKEQKVTSFSMERSAASSPSSKRNIVLFFDDDSMKAGDQSQARAAATKFIETNAAPNRYFAVVDYAGTLRITQNFTSDIERLKQVVAESKLSVANANSNASLGSPVFASYDAYANRNVLLALRSVARSMASLPGRKSLVWLTSGLPLTPGLEPDLTALIAACNRANVAVYPVDVRGLTGAMRGAGMAGLRRSDSNGRLRDSSYYEVNSVGGAQDEGTPHLVYVAQTKGGTGGTGDRPGGPTGGTTGPRPNPVKTTTPPPTMVVPSPFGTRPRISILPPPTGSAQDQILYSVANGTGGFVIANSNDLLAGLEKINKELDEYYILGYVPPSPEDGSCHTLKVKVEHSGAIVRARTGYCAVKPVDLLAGKPVAKQLEAHAFGSQSGEIIGSASAPFFYTSPDTARVNLAIEIPGQSLEFEKVKGKYHTTLNVLGIATEEDGTVAARFSDAIDLDFEKKDYESFIARPYHYENQFAVASGQYTLKVALSTGDQYGKFDIPLAIDSYNKTQFSMSGLALSKEFHEVTDLSADLDSLLLQDRTPLVTQGLELVPSGSNKFKKSEHAAIYLEVYEPLLAESKPAKVGLQLRVLDQTSGKTELEAGIPNTDASVIPGNPVIPMGVPLPIDHLSPGTYIVELQAKDSAGNSSPVRKAVFTVE
jgi:VWFA-related protein